MVLCAVVLCVSVVALSAQSMQAVTFHLDDATSKSLDLPQRAVDDLQIAVDPVPNVKVRVVFVFFSKSCSSLSRIATERC